MKDPKRLYKDESNRIGALLLRSGRADLPDRTRLDRIVAGLVGAGGALASSTAGATALSLSTVAQWFTVGAVAGVVASSTIYAFQRPERRAADSAVTIPAPAEAPSAKPIQPRSASLLVESAASDQPLEVPPALHRRPETVAPVAGRDAVEASRNADAATPVNTLAAEAAALARVKSALDRNSTAEAIGALRAYRARFANGALAQDAAYLEMEAELASGNRAAARRLAATMASGTTPNAERAREVLKEGQQ